ncbi:hypothetical protein C3941_14425 [Kaistia algarum]|uniref:E3 binding domain-containing protein n=1 Tax=Kaistia algarum TaxID=2083279 RepID=UPI000CE76545|nr:E3 binding domain-containing protein [Kaistia algarum]MCX5514267.1 E3 binding domain-containing protein [Kaistia algarum]PPE79027.1 hypothetical protein C3941_14425 [Kaistia algarum]
MSSPASRKAASPYARRLARERGIALAELSGSGPNGRIVAADVPLQAVAVSRPGPVPAPAIVADRVPSSAMPRALGAFSASIVLTPLRDLIAASGTDVPLDAFLAKAAASAAGSYGESLRLVAEDGTATLITAPARLAPSEIARLAAAGNGTPSGHPLVLSRLHLSGVRPVAGPLPADCDLRILVIAANDTEIAEAMLVHDSATIPEAEAARILSAFRAALENPLRLLV